MFEEVLFIQERKKRIVRIKIMRYRKLSLIALCFFLLQLSLSSCSVLESTYTTGSNNKGGVVSFIKNGTQYLSISATDLRSNYNLIETNSFSLVYKLIFVFSSISVLVDKHNRSNHYFCCKFRFTWPSACCKCWERLCYKCR